MLDSHASPPQRPRSPAGVRRGVARRDPIREPRGVVFTSVSPDEKRLRGAQDLPCSCETKTGASLKICCFRSGHSNFATTLLSRSTAQADSPSRFLCLVK